MHKIRKTYGTTLLDNQVAETLVANQMGHSDVITTKNIIIEITKQLNIDKQKLKEPFPLSNLA